MKHPASLVISVAILCLWTLQSMGRLPAAFVTRDYGQLTNPVKIGNIVGTGGSVILWAWLAWVQWRGRGRWGRRIGIFAIVVFTIQSSLSYLAISRAQIPVTGSLMANIALSAITAMALIICGFASYHAYRKNTQSTSRTDSP